MNENPAARPALILLIEDHPLTRRGLVSCLEDTRRFFVMGQAENLAEARRIIETAGELPSLVILDLMLNGENGLEFLKFLKAFCKDRKIPAPPVLICSAFADPFRIQNALAEGAAGYVPKNSSEEKLFEAIDAALAGTNSAGEPPLLSPNASAVYRRFTRREVEILSLVKQNRDNRQIAAELGLTLRTIENHISRLYLKSGCKNRQELINII